jgi:4-hydroxybenzoyl-CoA thioesterase/acyl-CoA thioester hydrolase
VEFRDTDAAGIMHFSAFFTMMEEVEHELLRSIGYSVVMRDETDDTVISWPRVAARCDFRGAARFEEVLDVAVTLSRLGEKSVTYAFVVSRGSHRIAEGSLTAVCCRIEPHQPPVSIPIPEPLRVGLAKYADDSAPTHSG